MRSCTTLLNVSECDLMWSRPWLNPPRNKSHPFGRYNLSALVILLLPPCEEWRKVKALSFRVASNLLLLLLLLSHQIIRQCWAPLLHSARFAPGRIVAIRRDAKTITGVTRPEPPEVEVVCERAMSPLGWSEGWEALHSVLQIGQDHTII